jgi:hypothetical protein
MTGSAGLCRRDGCLNIPVLALFIDIDDIDLTVLRIEIQKPTLQSCARFDEFR